MQAAEARGASYSDGSKRDIFELLKDHGFNYIRLRTFVDPRAADGYDKQNGFRRSFAHDCFRQADQGGRPRLFVGFSLQRQLGRPS